MGKLQIDSRRANLLVEARRQLAAALTQEGLGGSGAEVVEALAVSVADGGLDGFAPALELLACHFPILRAEQANALVLSEMAGRARKAGLVFVAGDIGAAGVAAALAKADYTAAVGALREIREAEFRSVLGQRGIYTFAPLFSLAERGHQSVADILVLAAASFSGSPTAVAKSAAAAMGAVKWEAERFSRACATIEKDRLVKRRIEEEARREADRVLEAWKDTLIDVNRALSRLGASASELSAWIESGRIAVAAHETFRKWGKQVSSPMFEPDVIEGHRGDVGGWRAIDAAASASRKNAVVQAETEASATRRWRADLLRLADDDAELSRDGEFIAFRVAIETPLLDKLDLLVSVQWPSGISRDVSDDRAEDRAELSFLIRRHLAGVADAARASTTERALAWEARVAAVAAEYAEADRVRFAELIRRRAREAVRGLPGTAAKPSVIAANISRILDQVLAGAVTLQAKARRLQDLKRRSGLLDYASMFPEARSMVRKLRFNLGPTNSGKTHQAMERLAQAPTGVYLAPLRLMALEAYDRLSARGVPTSMMTGEERIEVDGSRHTASTIEMANLSSRVDVAVVDEIQMLADESRGWAWTQAVIGIPASEIILTGSADALPFVVRLAEMCGDELEVVTFERKSPLDASDLPVDLASVGKGDAVIAFSRAEVLRFRGALEDLGRSVSVIYGALSPEVRRSEARRFRDGEADVLVATDAIGMGLNLPIDRIIFTALEKFDGTARRALAPPEIRQIAGRAGRYGISERGVAAVMAGIDPSAVADALQAAPRPPRDNRLRVMPPWIAVDAVAKELGHQRLDAILHHICSTLLADDPKLRPASLEEGLMTAELVEKSKLSLKIRYAYMGCPVDHRDERATADLRRWSANHANGEPSSAPAYLLAKVPESDSELGGCEAAVRRISSYLWLSQRWPEIYPENARAMEERSRLNGMIESALRRKGLSRTCRQCGAKLAKDHRFTACDGCFKRRN